jgi:hypothetical protein
MKHVARVPAACTIVTIDIRGWKCSDGVVRFDSTAVAAYMCIARSNRGNSLTKPLERMGMRTSHFVVRL